MIHDQKRCWPNLVRIDSILQRAGALILLLFELATLFRTEKCEKLNADTAPNLLEQDFSTEHLDEVWLADLTYVKTGEGWLYVSTLMDLRSRRIIGWAMGKTLEAHWTLSALQMALEKRKPKEGLHSLRCVPRACGDEPP